MLKTFFFFSFLLLLFSLGTLDDMILPSLPNMVKDFQVDIQIINMTVGVFVSSYAVFQLIYGPLSDRFGRKKPLLVGLLIYCFGTVIGYISPSVEVLILAKFMQGIGCCAGYTICIAIIKDMYDEQKSSSIIATLGGLSAIIPIFASLAGGYLAVFFHWKTNFIVFGAFGLFCILGVLLMKETNKNMGQNSTFYYFRYYYAIIKNKKILMYILVVSFVYGASFSYLANSSFLIQSFGFDDPSIFGISNMFTMIGIIFGGIFGGKVVYKIRENNTILLGIFVSFLGAFLFLVLGLFDIQNLPLLVFSSFLLTSSIGLSLPISFNQAMSLFPGKEGSVSAVLGCFQFLFGAGVAFLAAFILNQYSISTLILSWIIFPMMSFLLILFYIFTKIQNKYSHS